VTFSVSITQPTDAVKSKIDNLLRAEPNRAADDFDGLCKLIASNLSVAAGLWGRCFHSDERVSIEVVFNNSGRELAGGSSKGSERVDDSKRYPGKILIMEGAAYQIAGLGTPLDPGIVIELPVNSYLTHDIWFDPDAVGGSQPVPDAPVVDAVTLFLHEMTHALGINGRLVQNSAKAGQNGQPAEQWVSTFDECVRFDGKNFFFDGPSAVAENGGLDVPLSDGKSPNNTYTHIGNDAGKCALGRCDLMTGYPWKVGHRYCISRLDLAILKDVGLPIA
jgi:hypothetical protein